VAVVDQGLAVAATYFSENVAWTATNALRLDLTVHCLKLDYSFHKAHTPGELIERIDGDVNTLPNFFSIFLINFLGNILLFTGALALLFREDWRVGAGLSIFSLLASWIIYKFRAISVPYWEAMRQMSASFYGFLGELFVGTEDIRANGSQNYVMRRFLEIRQQWLTTKLKNILKSYIYWMTNVGIFALGYAIVFVSGAYLWRTGVITIGTIYLILRYTELLRDPLTQIQSRVGELQHAEASINRIQVLLDIQPKLREGQEILPHGALSVDFRDVSFGYNEQDAILNNITFQLQPGHVLGLLGRTGSGKTTLIRLLLHLDEPDDGEIRLGGVVLSDVRSSNLRRRIGMVTQDVELLQASIRDNLTFFDPEICDERIITVLSNLGLSEWLHSQPYGLDTEISSGGNSLSAGQAQLLAFARVFLADPGLVILDEASSRLDPVTEQIIENAVDKLLENRTAIIIAHHLTTVHRTDEILILGDGKCLEHGKRSQMILDPNSHFSHLLHTGLEEALV
jgi:ATP-binding cassette subfamily B protein/ATP-binding cassette subfamily C protein